MKREYTRIDTIRELVDGMLRQLGDETLKRDGSFHLYGTGMLATMLALKRGHDVTYAEAANVAGILHDFTKYRDYEKKNKSTEDHAHLCEPVAREILQQSGCFSKEETDAICLAIYHHSDKANVHGEMEEILKDADSLQHWLRNPTEDRGKVHENARVARLRQELGF